MRQAARGQRRQPRRAARRSPASIMLVDPGRGRRRNCSGKNDAGRDRAGDRDAGAGLAVLATRSTRCITRTSLRATSGRRGRGGLDFPELRRARLLGLRLFRLHAGDDVPDLATSRSPARRCAASSTRPLPGGVRVQPRRARVHDQRAGRQLSDRWTDWTAALQRAYSLGHRPQPKGLSMIRRARRRPAASAAPAVAQVPAGNSAPQPVPFVDTIPAPRDIALSRHDHARRRRDRHRARHLPRQARRSRSPRPGHMVLLYPEMAARRRMRPRGEIEKLAGLQSSARRQDDRRGRAIRSTSSPSTSTCPRARRRSTSTSSSSRRPRPIRAAS